MPSTYKPADALKIAKRYVRNVPIKDIEVQAMDMANSTMWTVFPWRWVRVNLASITLVDNTQDYALVSPDDVQFLRLINTRLTQTNITPNRVFPLIPTSFIEVEPIKRSHDSIGFISYHAVDSTLRLFAPPQITSPVTVNIDGEYHKTPTKITAATKNTPFDFPDHYFEVYLEGLKWALFSLVEDDRTGSVSIRRDGVRQYSGQLGVFHDALQAMMRSEDVGDAVRTFFPYEGSLGTHIVTQDPFRQV